MTRKIFAVVLMVALISSLGPRVSSAKNLPRAERTNTPEVKRAPIPVPEQDQLIPNFKSSSANTSSAQLEAAAETNLVQNPGFESGVTTPDFWKKGKWGNNNPTFYYPVNGHGGGRGVRVTMANRVTGDAKWYFDPVAVTAGTYTYSDEYVSSVQTFVTAEFWHSDGSITYKDLIQPAATPTGTWRQTVVDFVVEADVTAVSIFHLINRNGALTTDNISIVRKADDPGNPGIFQTGAVTIRLDDNWLSQYQNAFPILNNAGFKGTLYVATQQIADNNFPGYMSKAQIQEVAAQGHEIGAHTRNHPDLATISHDDQVTQIQGSRNDLLSWSVGPVLSFSYPFGSYTAETIQIVKDAGYQSAASSNGGLVTVNSDPYQLERRGVENTTTFDQIKSWIDQAIAQKKWLIITAHEVKATCPDRYCITTPLFSQMVDYLTSTQVPVLTISEAMASI